MTKWAKPFIFGVLGVASAIAAPGCAEARAVIAGPSSAHHEGFTDIVLDDHLPSGFRITHVRALVDGDVVHDGSASATSRLFSARLPDGDHTLRLIVEVRVPCGLAGEPSEKLTATIARSFRVGTSGGLVYIDAFARSAWLHPSDRVHLLMSLRGLNEGRWLYGRSPEAKQACGRLGPVERSRCVVEGLIERARTRRDVAGLLCQKDRLEAIDDLVAQLDALRSPTRSDKDAEDAHDKHARTDMATLETRAAQLEREAEFCVGEDPSWIGEQEVTSDRSACSAYDEPQRD